MKRSSLPFLLAAIIALVLGFSCQRDPSIETGAFVPQFREAVRHAGFGIVNESTASKDEVPLPFSVQWHPRRWWGSGNSDAGTPFPDTADHFSVVRDRTSRLECFVRYFDGHAQFIAIHAPPNEPLAAINLRAALTQKFPGFPIKIEVR